MVDDTDPRENAETAAPEPATAIDTAPANGQSPSGDAIVATVDSPASVEAAADDLARLVAEYDSATVNAPQPEPELTAEQLDHLLGQDAAAGDAERLSLAQQRATQLEQAVLQMRQQEYVRQELVEFDKFVAQAQEGLSDLKNLPTDFVRRWLIAEAIERPELRQAWDHRNDMRLDIQTRATLRGRLNGALWKLYDEAHKSAIDQGATEDRMAVIAAMRGAAGKAGPEPEPRLGNFTDRELNRYSEQFGFRAI